MSDVIQNPSILAYLNRLSDVLWLFGRLVEARRGVDSTLRAEGDQFTVLFDGKPMHSTMASTPLPRPSAGHIGIWTKSDSVTYFDSIAITPLPWEVQPAAVTVTEAVALSFVPRAIVIRAPVASPEIVPPSTVHA